MLALLCAGCGAAPTPAGPPIVATFSIVAFDPATGDLGVAVQSRFLGVGVVVPWVRADVGAVATQALANPTFGPEGLDLMDDGVAAPDALKRLIQSDAGRARRQVGLVDARGKAAAFTGKGTLAWAGHVVGEGYCCQGNILAGEGVVKAMAAGFEAGKGALAERLVAALRAGQKAGGDKRGRQSAALQVARRGGGYRSANDRYIDLRVDDHKTPIEELARLLKLRRGFGRAARVPERFKNLVRESRVPAETGRGPRALWEHWQGLRRAGDWKAVLGLANDDYRRTKTIEDLLLAETNPKAQQVVAARGRYIGTGFGGPEDAPRTAHLFFAVPGRHEAVMVLMVKEKDGWRTVP